MKQLPRRIDVFRLGYVRQGHEVRPGAGRETQAVHTSIVEERQRRSATRGGNPASFGNPASVHHSALDLLPRYGDDFQRNYPIVNQDAASDHRVIVYSRWIHAEPARISCNVAACQRHRVPRVQVEIAGGLRPRPVLRPRDVHHYSNRNLKVVGRLSHRAKQFLVFGRTAMRKIKPRDGQTGFDQLANHVIRLGSGTERANDLGLGPLRHSFGSGCFLYFRLVT